MGKMINSMFGIKKDEEENPEQAHRNFMKDQHTIDIATANEQQDYIQQQDRSDLLKWQQDMNDELIKLRHRLKGEIKYDDGRWGPKMIPVGQDEEGKIHCEPIQPLANDLFVDYIETQVEPFMSRNMFSSNLNEKRILEMLRNTCDDVADAMADSYDQFGIDFINYDLVTRLIKNTIIPGPFRALNDGQRRHDRTIAKRIEAFNERQRVDSKNIKLAGVNLG